MRAKSKLNRVHVFTCVVVSAVLGAVFRSWLAFGIMLIAGIGLAISSGAIRL